MIIATCGIDWAEHHVRHVAVVDEQGLLLAKARIADSPAGATQLIGLLAGVGDNRNNPVPVAIETPRGLLVATLHAAGRPVYAINPLAVARYRDRHSMAGRKTDHGDAVVLANILRTDRHLYRTMPDDAEHVQCLAILARAHQNATWRRGRAVQELRSLLRDYYLGFLQAFGPKLAGLYSPDARAILALAPTPWQAAALTPQIIENTIRKTGRMHKVDEGTSAIHHAFGRDQMHHPRAVENAHGQAAGALLDTLDAECGNIRQLEARMAQLFRTHPDYRIITSFPGLADVTGARILAEIGDDPHRFHTARALKAFAGSAPITRASGRTLTVTHRVVKNRRLAAVDDLWAGVIAMTSKPRRARYQQRREAGDSHAAALRREFNRMLGRLHHCLQPERDLPGIHRTNETRPSTESTLPG